MILTCRYEKPVDSSESGTRSKPANKRHLELFEAEFASEAIAYPGTPKNLIFRPLDISSY